MAEPPATPPRPTPSRQRPDAETPPSQRIRLNGLFYDGKWWCNCKPRREAAHRQVTNPDKKSCGNFFYCCESNRCGFWIWSDRARARVVGLNGRSNIGSEEPPQSAAPRLTQMPLTNFFKSGGRRGSNATDSPNGSLDSEEGVMEPESPTTRLGKRKRSDSDKSEGKGRAPGGAPGVGQAKSNAIEAVGTLTPPPTSPVKRTHDVLGQNPHQPSPKARRQVIATNDENDEYPVSSDEELGLSVLFERSSARVIQENSIADFREHGSTGRSGNSDAFYMPRSADLPTARMIDWEGNNKRLKVSEKSVSFQESNASSEQSASSRSNVHQMIEPIMSTLLHPDYVNDDKLKSARAQLEMISRQFRCLESTKNSLRSARMTKDIEIKNLRAKVAKMEAELNKANDEINDMKGGLITLYSKH